MIMQLESYYKGISFGFELDFKEKRLTIAFLFWGLNFIKS
jgi:hypothetical protein